MGRVIQCRLVCGDQSACGERVVGHTSKDGAELVRRCGEGEVEPHYLGIEAERLGPGREDRHDARVGSGDAQEVQVPHDIHPS